MKTDQDYISSFGALTLDHRFKRLMNYLLDQANAVYQEFGVPFRSRWQSTFTLIAQEGPLGVTEIANRVKLTHPAIIQITDGLLKAKLIRAGKDRQDARRRVFQLTAKGEELRPELEQIWRDLARAQLDSFQAAGWQVLKQLDAIETELERQSILDRVRQRSTQG